MALTTSQTGNLLFKKFFGKGSTNDTRQFFEEPFEGRPSVYLDQVWLQVDDIATTAPVLSHNQISGVVQYKQDLVLTAVPGTTNSFQSNELKDAIPFYFGDGSYNYSVKSSTSAAIPFGTNDWVIDSDAGILTFYNGVPANMPPSVSFYKYVGSKGSAILASPGIPIVQSIDSTVTALPTGTSFSTDDGYTVVDGSWVVFTNLLSGSNKIYQVSGVGSSLQWIEVFAFQGSTNPKSGNFLTITQGTSAGKLYRFDTEWSSDLNNFVDSNELAAELGPYLTSADAANTYATITSLTQSVSGLASVEYVNEVAASGITDLKIPLISAGNISAGSPVYVLTTVDESVSEASASSLGTSRIIGIAENSSIDTEQVLITIGGFADIPSARIEDNGNTFLRGEPVFLSEVTGKLSSNPPTTIGSRVYQVGIAVSTTKIIIDLKQGVTVA